MSERLNIKNMIVEPERKPVTPFNPAEMEESDWTLLETMRKEYLQRKNAHELLLTASTQCLLGRRNQLTASEIQLVQQYRKKETEENIVENVMFAAANETILGRKPIVSQKTIEHTRNCIEIFDNTPLAIMAAANLRIFGEELKISDEKMKEFKECLKEFEEKGWARENLLAHWRIINNEISLKGVDWDRIRKNLQKRSESFDAVYLHTLRAAAILSADEIHIPKNGGLELTWRKSEIDQEQPPLPAQRNF